MANPCKACINIQRPYIDDSLMAGLPIRQVANQVGLAPSSIHRHKHHLATALRSNALIKEIPALAERLVLKDSEIQARWDSMSQVLLGHVEKSQAVLAELEKCVNEYEGAARVSGLKILHDALNDEKRTLALLARAGFYDARTHETESGPLEIQWNLDDKNKLPANLQVE